MLTGLQSTYIYYLPFYNYSVISATFKHDGNIDDFIEPFKLEHKYYANISAFSFTILVGISEF